MTLLSKHSFVLLMNLLLLLLLWAPVLPMEVVFRCDVTINALSKMMFH